MEDLDKEFERIKEENKRQDFDFLWKYKNYILPIAFITAAVIMGINDVSGYGWMIFGAFVIK